MRFKILILLSLLFTMKMEAQVFNGKDDGFKLEVTIPSQRTNKVYMGQYQSGATYVRDSVMISDSGKGTFIYPKKILTGQYFVYAPQSLQVDLLIADEQNEIKIYIDEKDFTQNKVSGSEDTKLLWEYLTYIQDKKKERSTLENELENQSLTEQQRADLSAKLDALDNKMQAYIEKSINEHQNKWFGAFLKGVTPVRLPFENSTTESDVEQNMRYAKNHFFDNIDLTDARFWRTNYLTSYIDTYMQQWVTPIPDSLAIAASELVAKTKENEFCFKEMLSYLVNQSFNSDRIGDENIWARLAEDYILDKNTPWIDSVQIATIQKAYEVIKDNRIGMNAHNLSLEKLDGSSINTNKIDAEYLLLCFYSDNCHFCQDEMPKLHNEIYNKYKDKGLEIVAINISTDKDKWKEFVNTKGLKGWINCSDPNYKSQYWMYFDTSTIPAMFLLDKDKIIVSKKLDIQNLDHFLDFHIKQNGIN